MELIGDTENGYDKLLLVVMSLHYRFGRSPTEDEILDFVYGNQERRDLIWDSIYTPISEKPLVN